MLKLLAFIMAPSGSADTSDTVKHETKSFLAETAPKDAPTVAGDVAPQVERADPAAKEATTAEKQLNCRPYW